MSNQEYININGEIAKVTFWRPVNFVGQAATLDMTFEDQPVKINFHWPGWTPDMRS